MSRSLKYLVCLLSCMATAPVLAQDADAIEEAARQIEEMVQKQIGQHSDQFGGEFEKLMEAQAHELEKWAENYSRDWEKWADGFEKKMGHWAQSQEKDWEKWAQSYSKKWEAWGEQLEKGEIDEEELARLIESNLGLIAEMPIGELVDGALKEAMGELENAPWQSIGELQGLVNESLEKSLRQLETIDHENFENRADGFWKALSKQQSGLDVKEEKLNKAVAERLRILEKTMSGDRKLDKKKQAEMVEQIERMRRDAETLRRQAAREHDTAQEAREVEMQKAKMKALQGARGKEQGAASQKAMAKAKSKMAQAVRERALAEQKMMEQFNQALKKKRDKKDRDEVAEEDGDDDDDEADGARDKNLEMIYRDLQRRQVEIEKRSSELAELRSEIDRLREEIKQLKKDDQ